jgi:hypothetical protein
LGFLGVNGNVVSTTGGEEVWMNDFMKFAAILTMTLQCLPAAAKQEAGTQVNRTPWHVPLDTGIEQEHVRS